MIVLLDTDVLLDVALNREPFSEFSSLVLDSAEQRLFQAFLAWHSIANFYYIASSTIPETDSKDFIKELLQFVLVAPTTTKDALYATTLSLKDFEDALQIAAAKACNAEFIITRNTKHYRSSPIKANTPQTFCTMLKAI
jgi:predicted nucleic acid-binding protein